MNTKVRSASLGLHVGERVRVCSLDEILPTLDAQGCLDLLPFMPEMSAFCGQEFRVYKRFHKYSDYVCRTGMRRMRDAVLLDGVRCNGDDHGGCQALCLFIWKEDWLTRANESRSGSADSEAEGRVAGARLGAAGCTESDLLEATRSDDAGAEPAYSCQATEVIRASRPPAAWWDLRPWLQDLASGNVRVGEMFRGFCFWLFTRASRIGGYRVLVRAYNWVQKSRDGDPYPDFSGTCAETPSKSLKVQPGELVRVRSRDEIVATLDSSNKNRGMWFDAEMVRFCGGVYPVLCRVEQIIDNKTGEMVRLKNSCVILESVVNRGTYHSFNPRSEYPFWREIWLERFSRRVGTDPQDANDNDGAAAWQR